MTDFFRAALVAGAAICAGSALAAQEDEAQVCELRSSNGIVRVVICTSDIPDDALAEEGRRICGDDRPCGAWFWLSPDDAPEEAPESHDGLAPEEVRTSIGVYVAEQDTIIRITRSDG